MAARFAVLSPAVAETSRAETTGLKTTLYGERTGSR
jgi:hypothetical protein